MHPIDPHKVTPAPGSGPCLLCGPTDEPTVEHIIPQTLWSRFGIDPNRPDLAPFRTTLCNSHNKATSNLHERSDMMNLISPGAPVTRKTLNQLGDWAIWVTLLFALERGSRRPGSRSQQDSTPATLGRRLMPARPRAFVCTRLMSTPTSSQPVPPWFRTLSRSTETLGSSWMRPADPLDSRSTRVQ